MCDVIYNCTHLLPLPRQVGDGLPAVLSAHDGLNGVSCNDLKHTPESKMMASNRVAVGVRTRASDPLIADSEL